MPEQVWDLALTDLQTNAEKQGHSMVALGLPSPSEQFGLSGSLTEVASEMGCDHNKMPAIYTSTMSRANADQTAAVRAVVESTLQKEGSLLFLDGPGGTGKTFVECLCLAKVYSMGSIGIPVASSGVAAQ